VILVLPVSEYVIASFNASGDINFILFSWKEPGIVSSLQRFKRKQEDLKVDVFYSYQP
jgi:hypothetical protein